jgi:TolB protein
LRGVTRRVSVRPDGSEDSGGTLDRLQISSDGRMLAFAWDGSNLVPGDTDDVTDVFVRDLKAGRTWRVSVASDGTQGNDNSHSAAISANGRVGFASTATNLVPNDTNGVTDVFVHTQ